MVWEARAGRAEVSHVGIILFISKQNKQIRTIEVDWPETICDRHNRLISIVKVT